MCQDISDKHTFVICAYRESPYLETCILSLLKQKCKSTVIIATSTMNTHIEKLADKYGIKIYVNEKSLVLPATGISRCSVQKQS